MSNQRFTWILSSFILVCYIFSYMGLDNYKNSFANGDSFGYYLHVVSAFVNGDVGDYDKSIADFKTHYPKCGDPRDDIYGIRKTPKGRYYIKYSVGVGLMETPFFMLAHAVAKTNPNYPADGWSAPYVFFVHLSKIIYIALGFFFLAKLLLKYFDQKSVAFALLAVALASNLFYHGTMLSLAHPFLFFNLSVLLFLVDRFYATPNPRDAILIGIDLGLIALTRVPEVITVGIFLLWGVYSLPTIKNRIKFIKDYFGLYVLAALFMMVVFSLQIAYWYYVSGKLVFNPYEGETFNFLKPKIWQGWFNFKNGWLIYSPMMAFALIGLALFKGKSRVALFAAVFFVLCNAWIHYSYYVWNYYPGMGSRPMIETYPLLAFGLAAFSDRFKSNYLSNALLAFLLIFFSSLNIFQTWQMRKGLIYTQEGSSAFYRESFGKTKLTREAIIAFYSREAQPSMQNLQFIDSLYTQDFESNSEFNIDSTYKHAKTKVLQINADHPEVHLNLPLDLEATRTKKYIKLEVEAFRPKNAHTYNRRHLENLYVQFVDKQNKNIKWRSSPIMNQIGNPEQSIWSTGRTEQWGKAYLFVKIPSELPQSSRLKVGILNRKKGTLLLDNLTVGLFETK